MMTGDIPSTSRERAFITWQNTLMRNVVTGILTNGISDNYRDMSKVPANTSPFTWFRCGDVDISVLGNVPRT